MSGVVSLQQATPAYHDVTKTLRLIADQIDAGEYDFPVTTAVVIIGYSTSKFDGEDVREQSRWETFGIGPRSDPFTVRGLMMTAAMLSDDS